MKISIMQPYLFPYIGYFQMIKAVDQFVIYDDVEWFRGWINRNRILVQGKPGYITIPLQKASSHLKINERNLSDDYENKKKQLLQKIESAYRKAPNFKPTLALVDECLSFKDKNLSVFLTNALRECCNYLNISTPFILSSALDKTNELRAEDKIIDINIVLGATHYINAIGGAGLYDKEKFAKNGLKLSFIEARKVPYPQFKSQEFVPFLSIIDVMMFNSSEAITNLLEAYDLH